MSRADCEGRGRSGRESSTAASVADSRPRRLTRLRSWDFVELMPCRVALDRPVLRASLVASTLLAALAGAGCRETGSSDQDSRPLPAPEPPASAAALPLRDEPASAKRKAADEDDSAVKNKPAATAAKPVEPSTEVSPATPPTADAEGSAGTAPVAAVPSVPQLAAPSAACLSRCQGAMQGCLSAPVDGGVPGFGNLELCKKAFEACQAACAKQ